MQLSRIELKNFRNYEDTAVDFDDKKNFITGDNAQGKTNLLEAIYYLSRAKTFRRSNDSQLIRFGCDFFLIKGTVQNKKGQLNIAFYYNEVQGNKILQVNGEKRERLNSIADQLQTVLYSPDDLWLIKGGPAYRRRYFNDIISKISSRYTYDLVRYEKTLQQRNNILKKLRETGTNSNSKQLELWTVPLVQYGSRILRKRVEVLEQLKPLIRLISRRITGEKDEVSIKYYSSITGTLWDKVEKEKIEEIFTEKLAKVEKEEIKKGFSVVGPHRDDVYLLVNGRDLKVYGSQGQYRTAILALKLAEVEFLKGQLGEYPLLLLDDVFSELDQRRRSFLIEEIMGNLQIFITGTDLSKAELKGCSGKWFQVTRIGQIA